MKSRMLFRQVTFMQHAIRPCSQCLTINFWHVTLQLRLLSPLFISCPSCLSFAWILVTYSSIPSSISCLTALCLLVLLTANLFSSGISDQQYIVNQFSMCHCSSGYAVPSCISLEVIKCPYNIMQILFSEFASQNRTIYYTLNKVVLTEIKNTPWFWIIFQYTSSPQNLYCFMFNLRDKVDMLNLFKKYAYLYMPHCCFANIETLRQ